MKSAVRFSQLISQKTFWGINCEINGIFCARALVCVCVCVCVCCLGMSACVCVCVCVSDLFWRFSAKLAAKTCNLHFAI